MKNVFIDGPSFYWMRPALGIDQVEWRELLGVLREIGSEGISGKPLWVLNSVGEKGIGRQLRTAGFKTEVVETEGGRDDLFIIGQINALPQEITEIVLVSSDQG